LVAQRKTKPDSRSESTRSEPTTEPKKRRRLNSSASVSGAPAVKLASPGKPLPLATRIPIEKSLQTDMSQVRVHDDARSNKAADNMRARAFTYGSDIYLGSKERATDVSLMAHEAAHVVQQQQAPAVQMFPASPTTSSHEAEARHAAAAAMAGQTYNVQNRTGSSTIQLQEEESYWDSFSGAVSERVSGVTESVRETAEQGIEYVGETAERGLDWARERAWSLVERYAPRLEPILREGPAGVASWIGDKVVAGFENLFDTLTAPLQAVSGFLGPVQSRFSNALTWMRTAAAQIASGDCSALSQAAQMISDVFDTIAGPYIERLREFAENAQAFFSGVWEKLSAGASQLWDALSEFAGQAWTEIQNFVSWVWEETAPIRDMILGPLGSVWEWIKEKLGIRQQVSERGGIWEWVKGKVGDAWEGLKARVEPFKGKIYAALGVVAGVLVLLSPAGPFVILAGLIVGAMVGIRWIQQNFSNPNNLVQQRGVLEGQIIPTLMNAVNAISDKVTEAANGLAERLRGILTEMGGMARLIGGTFLSFAVRFVNWLVERFQAVVQWATEQLVGLANWVRSGLERLREFLAPVRAFLRQVGVMLLDLFRVVEFIGGRIWNAIPACIRDPFVNFLVNQILARLPFFGEIVTIPDIWQQIRESARSFIQRVFINGDLMAALTAIFRLILRVLNVPVELITQIFQRADQIIDQLARNPMGFLRNMLAALRQGFSLFFDNILMHLMNGALDWLFGQVSQIGIQRPPDFSLRSIFGLVMQILGLSVDFVWQRLGQRIGQERAQQLRNIVDQVTGALVWLRDLVTEGPGALWRHIQEQLGNLQEIVINAVSGWIMSTVVGRAMARLATMLDPSGIMLVVQSVISIYRGLQTIIQQAAQILGVINAFLGSLVNIGRGVIGDAASAIAGAMGRAISPMIAFLANQAGLGRVGRRIREAVMSIRERVTRAIDWLIDRVVRGGQFLLNLGRRAAGAVREWWRNRRSFRGQDGSQHSLYFERRGSSVVPIVNTTPVAVDRFLSQRQTDVNNMTDATQKQALQNHITQARQLLDRLSGYTNPTSAPAAGTTSGDIESQVDPLLSQLVNHLSALMVPGTSEQPVPRMVFTPGFSSAKAQSPVTVRYIFDEAGNHDDGSRPGSGTNSQAVGILQALGISRNWVRFHILNENLGGKGVESNLIPMPQHINNPDYLTNFENHLKSKYDEGKVVWMRATFSRYSDGIFIQSFTANGGVMTFDTNRNEWVEDTAQNVPQYSRSPITYPAASAIYINVLYLYPNPVAFDIAMEETNLSRTVVRAAFRYAEDEGWTYFNGIEQFKYALRQSNTDKTDRYIDRIQQQASATIFDWSTTPPEWGDDE
jgi:hypothetical protein